MCACVFVCCFCFIYKWFGVGVLVAVDAWASMFAGLLINLFIDFCCFLKIQDYLKLAEEISTYCIPAPKSLHAAHLRSLFKAIALIQQAEDDTHTFQSLSSLCSDDCPSFSSSSSSSS